MTKTATAGVAMIGGMTLLLALLIGWLVRFDGPGLVGAAVGAGLGIVNLVVGYWITKRSLRRSMDSALGVLLGGFLVRLAAVAVLIVVFGKTETVDATAFALTFMVFFFLFIMLEMLLVQRAMNRNGRTA